MNIQRSNGHTVSQLTAHIVWSTKYRYKVLKGDIQIRCRTMLIRICESEDVKNIERSSIKRSHSYAYRISSIEFN